MGDLFPGCQNSRSWVVKTRNILHISERCRENNKCHPIQGHRECILAKNNITKDHLFEIMKNSVGHQHMLGFGAGLWLILRLSNEIQTSAATCQDE